MISDAVQLAVMLRFVTDSQAFADKRLIAEATKADGEANLEAAVTRATAGGSNPRADSAHISTLAARRVVTGVDVENLTSALIAGKHQQFYGQDGLLRPHDSALAPVAWAYSADRGDGSAYAPHRIPGAEGKSYYADVQNPLPGPAAETGAGAMFDALA